MPLSWKIGEIIPVSKKPLPVVDNDLRPVTLTAIISKCFERLMLPKIMTYVEPALDIRQFAYLPERCTEDAVNTLLHAVAQHLDKPITKNTPMVSTHGAFSLTICLHLIQCSHTSY